MSRTPTADAQRSILTQVARASLPVCPRVGHGRAASSPTLWPSVYRGFPAHDPPASWHVFRHVPSRAPRPSACYPGFARASDGSTAARGCAWPPSCGLDDRRLGSPEHPPPDAPKHRRRRAHVSDRPTPRCLSSTTCRGEPDLLVRRLKRLGVNDVEQADQRDRGPSGDRAPEFRPRASRCHDAGIDGFAGAPRRLSRAAASTISVCVISTLDEIEPVRPLRRAGRRGLHLQAVRPDAAARASWPAWRRRRWPPHARRAAAQADASRRSAHAAARWCPRRCVN